ncbi:MAG: hypothetical protein IJO63_05425 [Bacilli bacterium]|nr:hypothetical protein [Bacilli bacterium]
MYSFEENINQIYHYLTLTALNDDAKVKISQFMDAYHQTLNEYLNSNTPNISTTQRLQALTGPVNVALTTPDDGKPHPAAELIKQKVNDHGKEMEKPFVRSLRNPNAPSLIKDDNEMMNGFSFAIIIVCFTIVLGMVLGALLFLIK